MKEHKKKKKKKNCRVSFNEDSEYFFFPVSYGSPGSGLQSKEKGDTVELASKQQHAESDELVSSKRRKKKKKRTTEEVSMDSGSNEDQSMNTSKKKRRFDSVRTGHEGIDTVEYELNRVEDDGITEVLLEEESERSCSPRKKKKKKKQRKEVSSLSSEGSSAEIGSGLEVENNVVDLGGTEETNFALLQLDHSKVVGKPLKKKKKKRTLDTEIIQETNYSLVEEERNIEGRDDRASHDSPPKKKRKKKKSKRADVVESSTSQTRDENEGGIGNEELGSEVSEEEEAENRDAAERKSVELARYIACIRENLQKGPVISRISYEQQQVNIMNGTTRKGKWLPEEDAILRENLEVFKQENPTVDVDDLFARKGRGGTDAESRRENAQLKKTARRSKLYSEYLCKGLNRTKWTCYLRAFRLFQDFKKLGKWSGDETKRLKDLHQVCGNNWRLIADKIGRRNQHLIDKLRREMNRKGPWTNEEDILLVNIIKKQVEETADDFNSLHDGLPWEDISREMKTRSALECRHRWVHRLRHFVINKTRDSFEWSIQRRKTLIEAICVQEVCVEELIDFHAVKEQIDGSPTREMCVRQFVKLKKEVPNYSLKSFPDILDSLCTKYFD